MQLSHYDLCKRMAFLWCIYYIRLVPDIMKYAHCFLTKKVSMKHIKPYRTLLESQFCIGRV
jgi:hypothetical protein